jgi:hypothetical protein
VHSGLPQDLIAVVKGKFTGEGKLKEFLCYLPPKLRAWSLCETFWEQGSWNGEIVQRDELVDEILNPIYNIQEKLTASALNELTADVHKLSVLFFIFAIASLVDMTLPPDNDEADFYFELGRSALALSSLFTSPKLSTIQALMMMAIYHLQSGRHSSTDGSWAIISLAIKLGQSVGPFHSSITTIAYLLSN